MRSNLGMSMTCIVNTTAVTMMNTESRVSLIPRNRNQSQIPPQCMHESLEEEDGVTINDYGVSY